MNNLLLEQPIYINRLFISIAGEMEAGIFLDYLFKKFSSTKNNIIKLNSQSIYNELHFYNFDIKKINKKLDKLTFLNIKEVDQTTYLYVIDLKKYETYLTKASA